MNLEDLKIYGAVKENGKFDAAEAGKSIDALRTSGYGKTLIAGQMREQILREMLYEGKARQLVDTYNLGQGEQAIFDVDVDVPAARISPEGNPEIAEIKSDRTQIDCEQISSTFIVKWLEQAFRKFDVMEASRRRGMASVQLQEDFKFLNLLAYSATLTSQSPVISLTGTSAADNNPILFNSDVANKITPQDIAKAIGKLRAKMLPAANIFLNPERMTDFLLFNVSTVGANGGFGIFAPAIQEEAWKTGIMGEVFGVPMVDSIIVPATDTYVLPPKEYLGKMAIMTDIDVRFLSDANKSGDVFNIWEAVGFLIRFVKGVCKITLS